MIIKRLLICAIGLLIITSCKNDVLPKPKSYLKLDYPENSYNILRSECPFTFEVSKNASIAFKTNCWSSISYPNLKATIHLTYREVDNNLNEILMEVEKMTFEHTVKADAIDVVPYENFEQQVFGKIYDVKGNVATNLQFSVTDSTRHVLAGALYFYVKPNYDSILPAIKYIEKDMRHLIETLEWK